MLNNLEIELHPINQDELEKILSGEQFLETNNIKLFEGMLIFDQCMINFEYKFIVNHQKISGIVFKNCVGTQKVSIIECNSITISDCHFKQNFSIRGEVQRIDIIDSLFERDIMLKQIEVDNVVLLKNLTVSKDLIFSKSAFENGIKILNSIVHGHLKVENSKVQRGINLRETDCKDLILLSSEIYGFSNFYKVNLSELNLTHSVIHDTLLTSYSSILNTVIWQSKINSFRLQKVKITNEVRIDLPEITKLLMMDCYPVAYLQLNGISDPTSFITFKRCQFQILDLTNIQIDGHLEFIGIKIMEKIKILYSNLKSTNFIGCDFSKARLIFKNSKISEVFIAESIFPKLVYSRKSNNVSYSQARLIYGQLGKAMSNIGDSVSSLDFQSQELHAHYKHLRIFHLKSLKLNFTKINLWLNLISNDFGRSWARGIVFSFASGITMFYLLTISTDRFYLDWTISLNWNLLPSFFRFMNPLRFFETEKIYEPLGPVNLTPISYVIDFFARVILAYGFYQTIQAFRRFGRAK